MDQLDIKKRIFAAHRLLSENTTTKEKFESVKTLVDGINPKIDRLLHVTHNSLSKIEKLNKGEVIELTVEHLPEDTEEKKKRKKALLFFIQNWKSLHNEVHRVRKEFEKENQNTEQKIQSIGRIISVAKGPFGLITAIAVIAVISFSVFGFKNNTKKQPAQVTGSTIKVILVEDKYVPLSEFVIGKGPECMDGSAAAEHYHAKNHVSVKAEDGAILTDPGGCGFGKVNEVEIVEIED